MGDMSKGSRGQALSPFLPDGLGRHCTSRVPAVDWGGSLSTSSVRTCFGFPGTARCGGTCLEFQIWRGRNGSTPEACWPVSLASLAWHRKANGCSCPEAGGSHRCAPLNVRSYVPMLAGFGESQPSFPVLFLPSDLCLVTLL